VQQYTLRMALDPASTEIKANVTITAAATLDQLETFSLDFSGYQIQELRVNGELAEYRREPNKLWVLLPALQSKGENFTVDIAYSGTGQNTPSRYLPVLDHVGMFFEPPDLIYVASEPDGAHDWFPCNDHPRDKAAFRFEIYVPQGMQVAANGTLLETNTGADDPFPGGGLTDEYVWEETSPMATYLATVAVSHYTRLDGSSPNGIPLRSYVFPSSENEFKQTSAPVGEALDWMSTMFGGYPFDKFGYVLVTNLGASLEDQTMVILDEAMLDENTMIHEMAHMWFGDWVSLNTWGEMWRNEGFATYISMMWQFRNNPQGLNQTIQRYEGQIQLNPSGYALDNLPPADLFGFDSYVKGAVVVHNLRQTVGDQAFFAGLKDYLAKYGGGTATDAQFQAVMEQASGMNLDAFFTKWVQSK
jgi:aminopeptidase N